MFELVSGFKNFNLHKSSSSVHVFRIERDNREFVDSVGVMDRCSVSHSFDFGCFFSVFLAVVCDLVFALFTIFGGTSSSYGSAAFELMHPIFLLNLINESHE